MTTQHTTSTPRTRDYIGHRPTTPRPRPRCLQTFIYFLCLTKLELRKLYEIRNFSVKFRNSGNFSGIFILRAILYCYVPIGFVVCVSVCLYVYLTICPLVYVENRTDELRQLSVYVDSGQSSSSAGSIAIS